MPVNYGHHRSDRIHDVLNPSFGIRDELLRRGIKPHDHTKDNRMKIKALEKDLDHERQIRAMGAKQAFFGGALAAKQNEQVSVQMQAVLPVVSTSQCLNTSSDSALSDITQL